MTKNRKLQIMTMIFITATLASNVMAGKVVGIAGFQVPAGVVVFPMAFVVTDIVNEIWGPEETRKLVYDGFFASAFFSLAIALAIWIRPADSWNLQAEYAAVLGSVPRIAIGGLVAFLVSQNTDIWVFHTLKKMHGRKHLWIRNTLSTFVSQFLDSLIFIFIAFYGSMPTETIFFMAFNQWLVKAVFALLDTPFVYAGVNWIRKGDK